MNRFTRWFATFFLWGLSAPLWADSSLFSASQPIRIGVIHSLSGAMATSESPMVEAVKFSVEEINANGGLLGRPVEVIVADGRSDSEHSAREAERLIVEQKVDALFGCWTSSCRKAVLPVVEQRNHLLFYPLQYEGMESSKNIVYTGSAPNQQIIPAFSWAVEHLGPKVYLIGSDYVFPRIANLILKEMAPIIGGQVVGETYLPLGSDNVDQVVADIRAQAPDVILNTINGETNLHFFRAWKKAGLPPETAPILSFSLSESLVRKNPELHVGHYLAWGYFEDVDTPENKVLLEKFRNYKIRSGRSSQSVMDDPMEATYIGVNLWAQTVRHVGSVSPDVVKHALGRQSFAAPQGIVSIDPNTLHLWRSFRVGKVEESGEVRIAWSLERPVRPMPFPSFRSKSYWMHALAAMAGR